MTRNTRPRVLCNMVVRIRVVIYLLVQGEELGVEDTQQGVGHEPLVEMAGK